MTKELTHSITEDQKIDLFIQRIIDLDPKNTQNVQIAAKLATEIRNELTLKVIKISDIIKKPLEELDSSHEENQRVANNLVALRDHVQALNPVNYSFDSSRFISKIVDFIPFIKNPIEKYKSELHSGEKAIKQIITSLEEGEKQLIKDNETLMKDQLDLWNSAQEINISIDFANKIDSAMETKITEIDLPRQTFIRNEFLFPLRQHILDLQQQSAVFMQADMSTKLIIDNNRQLINSVQRTRSVTVSALQVATMTSFALMNQKNVMTKIDSINKTTSDLLLHNAQSLKEQGTHIQKQATTAMLDLDSLKKSYDDLDSALNDIQQFRENTLVDMKSHIKEYEQFIQGTKKHIMIEA